MLYFKHSDLVNKYHISLKTVHNWVDAAKKGKLELKLHETSQGTYIANVPGNVATLAHLVEQRKKYRNSRFHKVVTPRPEFYELYTRRQILDIISNLNIHREIPRQYNYISGGADNWDKYSKRMQDDGAPNQLKSTLELLHANMSSIDLLLKGYERVNVVDLGVGNGTPVKELLTHLLDRGVLNRYIAIDISERMLHIERRNIEQWFGDKIAFEGYVRDISFERFDDLLVDDMLGRDADKTINLVLLLGGTPLNFRTPADILRTTYGSMGHEDLLVYTDKPDSETSRRYFKFTAKPDGSGALPPIHRFILDLLNIDDSLYSVELGYSEQKRMRFAKVRLRQSLTVSFKFKNDERNITLEKGDTILVWRVWHLSAPEIITQFEQTGFALLQSSLTKDKEYLLTISGIDNKANES